MGRTVNILGPLGSEVAVGDVYWVDLGDANGPLIHFDHPFGHDVGLQEFFEMVGGNPVLIALEE